MKYHGVVRGTQAVKPQCIEQNGDTVYIRGDIVRKTETRDDQVESYWEYTENVLSKAEYEQIRATAPYTNIPDDAWNDGLQTMVRTILYENTDGDRAKAERNIRLGIEVEANQKILDGIDAYCQAVAETKDAKGYPTNVPVYPDRE